MRLPHVADGSVARCRRSRRRGCRALPKVLLRVFEGTWRGSEKPQFVLENRHFRTIDLVKSVVKPKIVVKVQKLLLVVDPLDDGDDKSLNDENDVEDLGDDD